MARRTPAPAPAAHVRISDPALRFAPDPRRGRRGYLPVIYRRIYQGFFLAFFLAALWMMTDEGVRRFPVRFLFHADPLTAAATLGSSWLLPAGLLLSILVIALTVLFGRAFCGWICPLGTLNQLVSHLTRRARRGPPREVNRWRPHFRWKYLLLVACIAAALGEACRRACSTRSRFSRARSAPRSSPRCTRSSAGAATGRGSTREPG